MSQDKLRIGERRNGVMLALASVLLFGSVVCSAQTAAPTKREAVTVSTTPARNSAAQPAPNPFDQFDKAGIDAAGDAGGQNWDSLSSTPPSTKGTVGTIEDGYRFKGGDTSKQRNWEKVGGKEAGEPWNRPWNQNWDSLSSTPPNKAKVDQKAQSFDEFMAEKLLKEYTVVQALERGFSIDEIADWLAKYKGIDPALVRKRGYSSEEMLTKFGYSVPKPPGTEGAKKEASPRKDTSRSFDFDSDGNLISNNEVSPQKTTGRLVFDDELAKEKEVTRPKPGLFDDLLSRTTRVKNVNGGDSIRAKSTFDSTGAVMFWILLILGVTGYLRMRSREKATISQTTPLPTDGLIGIHGWLRFFVISLSILGPAFSFGRIGVSFQEGERLSAVLLNSA
ncbi:MAG: hypothetical protein PHH58_10200, partial [Rhodoferax sp.]|nr:hypothetical protein [Rhodoferax sp.]